MTYFLAQVVARSDLAGELEVIEGLRALRLREPQELRTGTLVEAEVPDQRAFDVLPFLAAELPIGVSQLEQQGACGQLHPAGAAWRRPVGRGLYSAAEPLADKLANGIEHGVRLGGRSPSELQEHCGSWDRHAPEQQLDEAAGAHAVDCNRNTASPFVDLDRSGPGQPEPQARRR
jgi:hypothetical protein